MKPILKNLTRQIGSKSQLREMFKLQLDVSEINSSLSVKVTLKEFDVQVTVRRDKLL